MLGRPPYLSRLGQSANRPSVFRDSCSLTTLVLSKKDRGWDRICFCLTRLPAQGANQPTFPCLNRLGTLTQPYEKTLVTVRIAPRSLCPLDPRPSASRRYSLLGPRIPKPSDPRVV